jgi:DNA-binding response OmpR family regulator
MIGAGGASARMLDSRAMRVLVVEDEPDVGDVFVDYLLELGHEPVLVRTAEDALGTMATERPDAILLDVRLPGMSGIEFLQLPPIRDCGVPIVAVSGVASETQARECLRLGAVEFVGKPLPLTRLQEVLAEIEPHARDTTQGTRERASRDRRLNSRAPLTVPVRIAEDGGTQWDATSVDVSVSGIRVSGRAAAHAGDVARLTFTPPDGGSAMSLMASLVRLDLAGYAFSFIAPSPEHTARLRQLVKRFV